MTSTASWGAPCRAHRLLQLDRYRKSYQQLTWTVEIAKRQSYTHSYTRRICSRGSTGAASVTGLPCRLRWEAHQTVTPDGRQIEENKKDHVKSFTATAYRIVLFRL